MCKQSLKELKWTDEKINSVCSATKYFNLTLITNKSGNNILIAGETHIKDKNAFVAGESLAAQFNLRGLEGFSGKIDLGYATSFVGYLANSIVNSGFAYDSTIRSLRKRDFYFSFNGSEQEIYFNGVKSSVISPNPFRFLRQNPTPAQPINIALERSSLIRQEIEEACPKIDACIGDKRYKYLILRRNEDMAGNIRKIIKSLNTPTDLLVIVGSRHTDDLSHRVANYFDSPTVHQL